ncbi:uncharacterized protein LOC123514145 [Portunus trituberculatus]|uniref:uncharacterized protein LOC123514145 n=1 Tax=Portunus trituberculatus TaxID=210409 RepID=UPI001E1CE176|nr:uncharacterized protein LOC123514145 [Portunus trituberculatus]
MSAVTSRFVNISRKRPDIVQRVMAGEFLALPLVEQDSPERPRKFPSYLITRYPVEVNPSLSKELPGVYSARRFYQNGKPLNRIIVTWSLLEQPPQTFDFSFLPSLPSSEIRRLLNDSPTCYRCWGIGHISRYCSAEEKCAWCSGPHDSRSCRYRWSHQPHASDAAATPPSDDVTSNWRCPRCLKQGVSVWHGCSRRPTSASHQLVTPPSLPPKSSASISSSPSLQVLALRQAVNDLKTRCASLESRLDAIEATLHNLVVGHASTEATLDFLVESHQTILSTLSSFTQRFDDFAARLGELNGPPPSRVAARIKSSSSSCRSPKRNVR